MTLRFALQKRYIMKKINVLTLTAVMITAVLLFLSAENLAAQRTDEEQLILKNYRLPSRAIEKSNLSVRDRVSFLEAKPFSGIAYERYANGQLRQVQQYQKGVRHGLMFIWYPDGTPQLMANYRHGILSGRFKGWYLHSEVIYDLVLNGGKFASDYLYDTDASRRQEGEIAPEDREGGVDDDQE